MSEIREARLLKVNTLVNKGFEPYAETFKISHSTKFLQEKYNYLENGQEFNFKFEKFKKDLIYIDTIYNPLETKTYKFLKERDVKVYNGLDMFVYQGQKSFYLWNKINPEIDQKLIEILLSKLK